MGQPGLDSVLSEVPITATTKSTGSGPKVYATNKLALNVDQLSVVKSF